MDSLFSVRASSINFFDPDDQAQEVLKILNYHLQAHYDVDDRNRLLKYFHASSAMDCFEICKSNNLLYILIVSQIYFTWQMYFVIPHNYLKSSSYFIYVSVHEIRPNISKLSEPCRTLLLSCLNSNSEEIFRILQSDPLLLVDPIFVDVECKKCTKYGKTKIPWFLRRIVKFWSFLWD